MVEGAVAFLLNKLSNFTAEQKNLLCGVHGDAKFIKDGLEFSLAFLKDAEAIMEEENNGDIFKVWVKKVRDIAYDMEDVLDNFNLYLAHNHGHGLCACVNKSYHFIFSLKARYQIASTMQDIKKRVREINETRQGFSMAGYTTSSRPSNARAAASSSIQQDALPVPLEDFNLLGIKEHKGKLIGWLVASKSGREVVSVVGMEGLGKTTLAKRVFGDARVKKHFKFCVWITLTQHFSTRRLLKEIVRQLFLFLRKPSPSGVDGMTAQELRILINEFLEQRRYLIVLDDVWSHDAWDAFKFAFPNNNQGSRILLTTQDNAIAYNCCMESPDKVYNLSSLSPEESWSLFCKKTFGNDSCPQDLENVSQQIVGRCEGLPLAIVAISGVLAKRDKTRDEWDMVYRSLGAEILGNDSLASMRKILSLSYNYLPYYLKSCLLYFSIFPEGYPIEHMRLIRLWIAEGFVIETEGKTLEEVAEGYLDELIRRSLIRVVETTSDGRIKRCRIQGFLREIIISKAKDQDFTAIVKQESIMWPEKARRLSIHNPMARIESSHFTSRLCSLLLFWGLSSLPEESPLLNFSCTHLRMLNVLDLGGTPMEEFPNQVTNLLLLKYLSLRNTKVNSIPSSIGRLQNLETLDLKNSRVTELPITVLKLQKLRHLLVYRFETKFDDQLQTNYTIGFKLPTNCYLRSLKSLQKLCYLEANDQDSDLIKELGTLDQLRRLGIVNLRKEDGKDLCSSIEKLTNLRALSVASVTENEVIDLDSLSSPPQFLQRLYLTGRLESLPEWITSLDSLKKVVLKWSRLNTNPLLSLQHLPNLLHVEFIQVYDGEALVFEANGFKKMKFLSLNKLDRLNEIIIRQGALPCLEKLIVQSCQVLRTLPSGIEHLMKLQVLEFVNMPIELIMTLHPDRNLGDYTKVARIPEVYFFTYWNNGSWEVFSLEKFIQDRHFSRLANSIARTEPYFRKLKMTWVGSGHSFPIALCVVAIIIMMVWWQELYSLLGLMYFL
ncbi:hypothetical protein JCGZ_24942 [Jatropha curcas]|uniref:Uncharacterized protein n=1 Tax=Jatropha curcas TaxID=180498 RepID=A0A067L127_JATCU|nr:disease resistance protein RPM1 [Jatropha curcas]KDP40943.1 hypothetical protein JCGZ_24942 [Jatropha curcas]